MTFGMYDLDLLSPGVGWHLGPAFASPCGDLVCSDFELGHRRYRSCRPKISVYIDTCNIIYNNTVV